MEREQVARALIERGEAMLLHERLQAALERKQQDRQVTWFEVSGTPDGQAEVSARVPMSVWRDDERLSNLSDEIKGLDGERYIHLVLLPER